MSETTQSAAGRPDPTRPPAISEAAQRPPLREQDTQQPATPRPVGSEAEQAKSSAAAAADPMQELLMRMGRLRTAVNAEDPSVGRAIGTLLERAGDPDRQKQAGFRHEVAYTLQDIEKTGIGRLEIPSALRTEMTQLAGSAAGLENPRMQAVVRATEGLSDRGLVNEIRETAKATGRQTDQATPDTISKVEVLENKVRLARRPAEPVVDPDTARPSTTSETNPSAQRVDEQLTPPAQAATAVTQQVLMGRSLTDGIFSRMRGDEKGTAAPWDPEPTPFKDRLTAFETAMKQGKEEGVLDRVEKSGRAALDAIKAFGAGEGSTLMNRINEAAKTEPGGVTSVLSEMREGGRFADLRNQFNNALLDERGTAKAYDKAAAALAQYGQDRPAAAQAIAGRPDAANLAAKFDQLDRQVGEASATTPSRTDGKSMIDDLAKSAAELLQRAYEGVKAVFSRGPSNETPARAASPSPG